MKTRIGVAGAVMTLYSPEQGHRIKGQRISGLKERASVQGGLGVFNDLLEDLHKQGVKPGTSLLISVMEIPKALGPQD